MNSAGNATATVPGIAIVIITVLITVIVIEHVTGTVKGIATLGVPVKSAVIVIVIAQER